MRRRLSLAVDRFPIAGRFTIARGSRTEAAVVTAVIEDGPSRGRGECVPYARYGETLDGVMATIERRRDAIERGAGRVDLLELLPPGAARNALDCALWDLEAKQAGVAAHVLAGIDRLRPVTTAFTISLGEPQVMAAAATAAAHRPILKIKLGAPSGDPQRIAAVRAAAPDSILLVDANEGWRPDTLAENLRACAEAGVALVEQPLPADDDRMLAAMERPLAICADESVHTRDGLGSLRDRYDAVNIKLDKAGGLTEALLLAAEAERLGLAIMVGCMVGSSLAMAPAMLLTPKARFVDLDGPLLLAADRPEGLTYDGSLVFPPTATLWG
ncbi:N-acetyl-D-Glu racemase DgcA [Chelatococcus reniformis]|uniref:Dipeptide epimerase n=1 Tax=Chelatococcus reniformis TaxID=1494448 RepID=A0A916URI1_9HYPH|nr:N-acetyl-D-Glu racemase DgcA [Chelatococcus reniformis]GGC84259.1 dipeptide epimerase [Chelatococcus reniformis]